MFKDLEFLSYTDSAHSFSESLPSGASSAELSLGLGIMQLAHPGLGIDHLVRPQSWTQKMPPVAEAHTRSLA